MFRKWWVGAATVVASAMLLTGCAGGGGVAGSSAGGGASGEPVAGGSATVLLVSEARTLDPAFGSNNNIGNAPVMNGIFGTLLVTDPETHEVVPSMATSFTSTDGGKSFVLTLRDGLTFSDGSPLEASDVKAHWDRVKDPATGTSYQGEAALVASTEAVSPTTLRATMVAPVPNFGNTIVSTVLNWVPEKDSIAAGGPAFDENPIGAGPYTLKEWRRQDALVLVKNPDYWDAPRPYLDEITFRPSTDAGQRLNTVVTGGADVALESNWLNLKKAEQAGLVVRTQSLSGGNYLAMNTRRAPFDDVRARRAVALALDPQSINASAFNGAAELVDSVFSPESPLNTGVAVPEPDKVEAQRLFDELAAEGKPVSFTVTSSASTEGSGTSESIQTQLSAFDNVEVEIELVQFAAISALAASKDFDATEWSAAFLDPDPKLFTAFEGSSRANQTGIDDPELNAALLAGRTSSSVEERKAAYKVVAQRLNDLRPNFWTSRNNSSVISGRQVGGLNLYGFGSLRPELLWIQN